MDFVYGCKIKEFKYYFFNMDWIVSLMICIGGYVFSLLKFISLCVLISFVSWVILVWKVVFGCNLSLFVVILIVDCILFSIEIIDMIVILIGFVLIIV